MGINDTPESLTIDKRVKIPTWTMGPGTFSWRPHSRCPTWDYPYRHHFLKQTLNLGERAAEEKRVLHVLLQYNSRASQFSCLNLFRSHTYVQTHPTKQKGLWPLALGASCAHIVHNLWLVSTSYWLITKCYLPKKETTTPRMANEEKPRQRKRKRY